MVAVPILTYFTILPILQNHSINMRKLILAIFALLLFYNCHLYLQGDFLIQDIERDINENTKFRILFQADDDSFWALFGSYHYGYYDYWVANSKDKKEWKKYFTGEKILSDERVRFGITNGAFEIIEPDVENRRILIPIEQLDLDSDDDGLTDIEENRLWTDPYRVDTDEDGIIDNFDRNPLVTKKDSLNDRQKLIKLEIESYLEGINLKQTIIVTVNREEDKMEFEPYNWRVLCLTEYEAWDYLDKFGYDLVVINAIPTIKEDMAKVEFSKIKSWDGFSIHSIYKKNKKGKWILVDSEMTFH